MKIGFIGTGVMGSEMIKNLIKNNYEVNCYNRTFKKAKLLEDYGAIPFSTIQDCVKNVDVIITIVGYPKDVEEVYEDIFKYAQKGTILIDMTTSKPSLAINIYQKAKELGMNALDAPVSGGQVGAKNGTLSIMVGGDIEIYELARPIFLAMGKTINYLGKPGNGQHCKMANQIAIAGTIASDMEAMVYAIKMGLDVNTVYAAISKGAASSSQFDNIIPKALVNNYEPSFYLKHFIKDMNIAIEETNNVNLSLPILNKVCEMYEQLQNLGYGDCGTQALIKYYLNDKI